MFKLLRRLFKRFRKDEYIPVLTDKGWVMISKKRGLTEKPIPIDEFNKRN